jgi:D-3-phosphoglycerate dehydrogenase
LHGHAPRLLAIDDIDIEAPLERNLIYLRNRDVPGVIGKVGTILGEHQINIANFSLGREGAGTRTGSASSSEDAGPPKTESARAVAVIHVDGPVPETVLASLREVPAIEEARALRLF